MLLAGRYSDEKVRKVGKTTQMELLESSVGGYGKSDLASFIAENTKFILLQTHGGSASTRKEDIQYHIE